MQVLDQVFDGTHDLFKQLLASSLKLRDKRCDAEGDDDPPHRSLMSDLTIELLELVFSFLPSQDVIQSAACVCRHWRDTAYSPALWAGKLDPQVVRLSSDWDECSSSSGGYSPKRSGTSSSPPTCFSKLPRLHLALYERNLLRNPGFRKSLNTDTPSWSCWRRDAWVLNQNGGSGVEWESPSVGGPSEHDGAAAARLMPEPMAYPRTSMQRLLKSGADGPQRLSNWLLGKAAAGGDGGSGSGCLATSYQWAEIVQVVHLVDELVRRGLTESQAEELLDSGLTMGFSIMIGGRRDTGGQAAVTLMLDEVRGDQVPPIQKFVAAPCRHHYHSGYFKILTMQGAWKSFIHSMEVPRGCRRATIVLRGKDHLQLPGAHGTKFACAQLFFIAPADRMRFLKDQVEAGQFWRPRIF